MRKLPMIAALLVSAASACNRPPAPQAASHPPAVDLVCPAEPAALTEAEAEADTEGVADAAFNDAVLLAGRGCRDGLARVCRWHVERGLELPAGIRCEP